MKTPDIQEQFATLVDEVIVRDVYRMRRYAAGEFDTILDVGANVGLFAVYARMLQPEARIIAVECDALVVDECLMPNVEGLRIDCRKLAVSQTENIVLERWPNSFQSRVRPGEGELVRTICLEDLIAEYGKVRTFLKIDIEGTERQFVDDPAATASISLLKHVAIECHYLADSSEECQSFIDWAERFAGTHDIEWSDISHGHRTLILSRR